MEIDITMHQHAPLHQLTLEIPALPNYHLEKALDGLQALRVAGHSSFIDSEIAVKRCYAIVLIDQGNYPLASLHVAQAFLLARTGRCSLNTMHKLAVLVDLLKTKMTGEI